jgi:hypothetical protein
MNPVENIRSLLGTKGSNPLILMLIGFFDTAALAAYGAQPAKAQYFWQIAARNILDFKPLLLDAVAASPTQIDDAFVNELCQAAVEICPSYTPPVWPG